MSGHSTRSIMLALSYVILASLVTTGLIGTSAIARPSKPIVQAPTLQKDVNALVTAGAPGAILLVRNGSHSASFKAGLDDVTRNRPMRADDHFKIASLTKSYTATVVLQLVAEGKLQLSDRVERWLPRLLPSGATITIRELLNHTSGIPDFDTDARYLKPYLSGNLSYYWSPRKLVQIAISHKPLFPPGMSTKSAYSNTNYVVLGLIVQAVTGHSMGAELKRRIFQPLHLRHTSYPTKPGLPNPYAHGYLVLGKPPASDASALSPSLSPASGAIVSTAPDVLNFYRALLSGRLLRPNLLKAMKTTIPESGKTDIPGQRYGFGLERFPTSCGHAFGHNGLIPGYTTYAFSSGNGQRQALLMVNEDAGSLPAHVGHLFFKLIDTAYCSTPS
ncbi:MAG: beta-lactamase family protein [Actinomycetota bacterium]|nr:beta-lactamase family protein [Actinomycetota bacterium]